jgi:hypothetical protein
VLCIRRGSDDLQACAKQVVAEQCGDEIASVLDGLADRVRTAADCPSSRLRSIAQLKRRGIKINDFTYKRNLSGFTVEKKNLLQTLTKLDTICFLYSLSVLQRTALCMMNVSGK